MLLSLLAAISLGFAAAHSPVCDFRLTLQSDGQKKYTNGSSVYGAHERGHWAPTDASEELASS